MKKQNKTSKLAIRLEAKEKNLLNYFATRLGVSASSLVRNQIKSMLQELEDKVTDSHYINITKINTLSGPSYSQDEIEDLFEINSKE
jgi:predicted DNA-binding protein